MNAELNKILAERGNTHGDFSQSAYLVQSMKSSVRHSASMENVYLSPVQWEALDNIFGKIGRIVCGDPSHVDSWVDIQGYAKLAEDNTKQIIAQRLETEHKAREWELGRGQRGIASPFLEPAPCPESEGHNQNYSVGFGAAGDTVWDSATLGNVRIRVIHEEDSEDPNPNYVGSGDLAESLLYALIMVLKEQPLKG